MWGVKKHKMDIYMIVNIVGREFTMTTINKEKATVFTEERARAVAYGANNVFGFDCKHYWEAVEL